MKTIDARLYQIVFLSMFLLLGIAARDWTLQISHILMAIVTCCLSQWLGLQWVRSKQHLAEQTELSGFDWFRSGLFARELSWSDFYSPVITALGLSLLLRVDHIWTIMIAGSIAVLSKFLLQVNGKHIFNPANFGIVAAMLLTHDAWVSPGQWGESAWFVGVFLLAGGLVLQKVGRWETTIAFLGCYAGLEALRNLYLGWTWDVVGHRLMSGSLVMFALFMITDPRTIPNHRSARMVWAGLIALVTFILRNLFFLNTAVFWALFMIAPLTILFDRLFEGDRFVWRADDPVSELEQVQYAHAEN
jgi:Na+-transporting NADH:ubiquinone oxidoreductase subunit NqrB